MISKREVLLLLLGTLMVTTNAYQGRVNLAQASSRMSTMKQKNLAQSQAQSIVSIHHMIDVS